MQAELVSETLK